MAGLSRARSRRSAALVAGAGAVLLLVAVVSFGPRLYSSSAGHDPGAVTTNPPASVVAPLPSAAPDTSSATADAPRDAAAAAQAPPPAPGTSQAPRGPVPPGTPGKHRPSKSNDVYDHM
jgi:hypothetical protein